MDGSLSNLQYKSVSRPIRNASHPDLRLSPLLNIDYFWNDPQSKQIISRGVRITSHANLPEPRTLFLHSPNKDKRYAPTVNKHMRDCYVNTPLPKPNINKTRKHR
nr:hypothetical protein Cbor_580 [Cedratvirus borely]